MNHNELNDFFESEQVKQLLTESYAAGYIYLRHDGIDFKDTNFTESLYNSSDMYLFEYKYVQRACQFIDDVVNDRFDLHTLNDAQFKHLYEIFVTKRENCSLLSRINSYYVRSCMSNTIYVLPDYFTFRPKPLYHLKDMTVDEAYVKLHDVIYVAKTCVLLSRTDAEQVFQSKLIKAANERTTIKELNAE